MKYNQTVFPFEERLETIERQLRIFRIAGTFGLVALVLALCIIWRVRSANADEPGQVLRVRGLIIEDPQGRPRILLGAPVPNVVGRKRQDDATGLIVLGENGADRVAIGAPTPGPQAKGQVVKRTASLAGLVFDDSEGNERGGMGVLDNGRGIMCLDYPDPISREAICMGVFPQQGVAGFTINAESASRPERVGMAVTRNGTSGLKLADTNGNERVMFMLEGESPAQLLVLDPKTKSKTDVLAKLMP